MDGAGGDAVEADPALAHLTVVRLRTHRQVRAFRTWLG